MVSAFNLATGWLVAGLSIVSFASTTGRQAATGRLERTQREEVVTTRASGTFEVKLAPLPSSHGDDSTLGRMSLDKQFLGDLEGVGKGEMLTAGTSVKNSAAYVAVERISGVLHGKRGTFVVHHTGIMDRGAQHLTITVVPDSGTDELAGITGAFTIRISDGKHYYDFDYNLPAP